MSVLKVDESNKKEVLEFVGILFDREINKKAPHFEELDERTKEAFKDMFGIGYFQAYLTMGKLKIFLDKKKAKREAPIEKESPKIAQMVTNKPVMNIWDDIVLEYQKNS